MRFLRFFGIILAFSVWPALAQERVVAHRAQLSGPFGTDMGKIVITGDRMIFVDDVDPANSFSVPRTDITRLDYRDGVMTLNLNRPFSEPPYSQASNVVVKLFDPSSPRAIASWVGMPLPGYSGEANREVVSREVVVPGATTVYEFAVKHGDDHGRLLVGPTDVRFESLDHSDHSRMWTYSEIKEFKLDRDDHEIKIVPYHGDSEKFKVSGDKFMTDEVYRVIGDRVAAARR